MTSLHAPPPSISLFGFNLSSYSRSTQFLLISTAVLTFHVTQGYIQVRLIDLHHIFRIEPPFLFKELILQLKPLRAYPNYFTLVQFVCFTVLAYGERLVFERSIKRRKSVWTVWWMDWSESLFCSSRAPLQTYAIIAFFTIGTMGLSNAAVMRLNYPTHMMFKSCKLIPVMIGSMLILGTEFHRSSWWNMESIFQ